MDLVTFTEEIHNEKHFLCCVSTLRIIVLAKSSEEIHSRLTRFYRKGDRNFYTLTCTPKNIEIPSEKREFVKMV